MATTRKFTLKNHNGTDWDTLYPKTSADNVETTDSLQFISADEKTKLSGIETGANKTVVENVISTSTTSVPSSSVVKTINDALVSKAPLTSPTFTGTPKAPTQSSADNSTNIATTAFVKTALSISGANSLAITVSTTEPTTSKLGDFWYQVL